MISDRNFWARAAAFCGARVPGRAIFPARLLCAGLLVVLSAAGSWAFADETDKSLEQLVRLVGRDAGLCVEIPRLEQTVTAFEQGEFFQRLQRSRIFADWQSGGEYRRARGIVTVIENFTGKTFRQFFHDMFGRAVVVAVYAEPGPKMSAIMLTETSSRQALDAVIEGWNRAEPQETLAIEFAGHTYHKRVCSAKEGPGTLVLFYCKLDRTLMLTDREEWIRRSLTLARPDGLKESLLTLPAYQAAKKSLQAGQAATAYVNPRAWDGVLGFPTQPAATSTATAAAQPQPSALARGFEASWRRCEWLALGLQVDRGIVVEAVARYSMDGISERGRQWIRSMSGPAEFLRFVPQDSLVVVGGRLGFGKLLRHLAPDASKEFQEGLWDSLRQVSRGLLLGLDPFEDVLPAFRENFGAYIAPRKDAKPEELPLDGLIAAELPPADTALSPRTPSGPTSSGSTPTGSATGNPSAGPSKSAANAAAGSAVTGSAASDHAANFRDALDNGLNIGFNLAAAYFNMRSVGRPAVVRTETSGAARTRWIDSLGPYQPAYSLTSRFLVFATRPQAIRQFIAGETASESGKIPPAITELAKRYFPQENQVIYIDTAAIRRFLVEHGPQLIHHATRVRSVRSADAQEVLANFLDVASLFDSVFAAGRIGEGSARLVVGGVIDPHSVAKPAAPARAAAAAASRSEKSARAD